MDQKGIININLERKAITKLIAFSFAFFSLIFKTDAQEFRLAGLQYNNYQRAAIKDATDGQEIAFHEFGIYLNIPTLLKNKKTTLINGVGYAFVEANMYNLLLTSLDSYTKKLQEVHYQLIVMHQFNDKWGVTVNLRPSLASDFEESLSSDDFLFQGAILATRTIHERLKIGAGIAQSSRFGESRVIPLVSLNYKKNKHQVNALLPVNLKYTYSLLANNKLALGVKYNSDGANFNVSDDNLNNVNKINYSRTNLGILTQYNFAKGFRAEAYGGISTNRKYNFVDIAGNTLEVDSKGASFFNIGIVYIPSKRK